MKSLAIYLDEYETANAESQELMTNEAMKESKKNFRAWLYQKTLDSGLSGEMEENELSIEIQVNGNVYLVNLTEISPEHVLFENVIPYIPTTYNGKPILELDIDHPISYAKSITFISDMVSEFENWLENENPDIDKIIREYLHTDWLDSAKEQWEFMCDKFKSKWHGNFEEFREYWFLNGGCFEFEDECELMEKIAAEFCND